MSLEKVSFGEGMTGYASAGPKDKPAVIVLQEWWGITDSIKEQALKLHQKGYRVLCPDLYHGRAGIDAEEASHLMNNLDWPRAVEELKQAAQWLRKEGAPRCAFQVGAIGFCMGGALAFLAAQEASVEAAAPFYGTPDKALAKPEKVNVPIQAHSGSDDSFKGFADPETMQSYLDKIKTGGNNKVELYIYQGEGHAFMNDREHNQDIDKRMATGKMPKGDPKSQALAWERVFDFFNKTL